MGELSFPLLSAARQAKPRRAHTREACISAPLSNVAKLRFPSGIEKAEKGGDTYKHENDTP